MYPAYCNILCLKSHLSSSIFFLALYSAAVGDGTSYQFHLFCIFFYRYFLFDALRGLNLVRYPIYLYSRLCKFNGHTSTMYMYIVTVYTIYTFPSFVKELYTPPTFWRKIFRRMDCCAQLYKNYKMELCCYTAYRLYTVKFLLFFNSNF